MSSHEAIPGRVNVLGVGISPTTVAEAIALIDMSIREGKRGYVCVTGVHGVMESQKDEQLKRIHNASLMTVPDGMPMVWAGRLQGYRSISRVYGPDLMIELCRRSVERGYRHFLYGGGTGIADALKKALEERFPGICIAGTYTPPFRPLDEREEQELKALVAALKPDIFWVGISTPKQEYFMAEYIGKLDAKVMLGVGAAFDIHTGVMRDAPDWMKKTGLQWLYRMYCEPKRLWKRYLYNNPVFLYKFMKQMVTGKY